MKAWLVAVSVLLTLATSHASSATEVLPAWQSADFVMEEVVVTTTLPAWLNADFVLEEVVATASAEDIAAVRAERQQPRARIRLARSADVAASQ